MKKGIFPLTVKISYQLSKNGSIPIRIFSSRELVSNACDAVTKLKKLMIMGEADHIPADEAFSVHVVLNKEEKIMQIVDNGIGMTHEEIKKYINQIAFSGATDFLSKYEEKADGDNEIIGHFGLGFYSAFMVADKVEIDTLSYQEGAAAASWSCADGIDYEMADGTPYRTWYHHHTARQRRRRRIPG